MLYDSSAVRRQDRLLDEPQALALLAEADYGFLALSTSEGGYGVPLNFVLCGSTIYFHSAMEGRKLRSLEHDARATFCVVGTTQIHPQEFTTAYSSVIVQGRLRKVESDQERMAALKAIVKKYSPQFEQQAAEAISRSQHRTAIIAMECHSFSGKCKKI